MRFPTDTPLITPIAADLLLVADTLDSNNLKSSTIVATVIAGMAGTTLDSLPQGINNIFLTPTEWIKLSGIQAGAQQNAVNTVNGQLGAVVITMDSLPNGTYVKTHNDFTNAYVIALLAASSHILNVNNPHNTTKTQVGLGSVTNDAQLKRSAGDFNSFPSLGVANSGDIILLENSLSGFIKEKITVANLANSINTFITPIAGWVDKSLSVVGGKIQLANDLTVPADDFFYGKRAGVKGWFSIADVALAMNQTIGTLTFIDQIKPATPPVGEYTLFVDIADGFLKARKPSGAVVDIERDLSPCSSCFGCNEITDCIASNVNTQDAISIAIDNNINIQNSILAIPGIGGVFSVYDEGTLVHTTNKFNFIGGGITATWNGGTNTVDVTVVGGALDCAAVKVCIEAFTTLDLSGVDLTLGNINGNITFGIGTTIDWTNTSNTGIQNFIGYTSNYDNTDIINNNGNTINNTNNTITNIGVTETFDATSNFTNLGNTILNNLIVTGDATLSSSWVQESYTGTGLGGQTYTTIFIPTNEFSLFLINDSGTELIDGVDYTYTILTHTINFIGTGPTAGQIIYVKYMRTVSTVVTGGLNNDAFIEEFIATGGQTVFNLAHNAIGSAWIWVSSRSGLYDKQGITRDYTMTALNQITLTFGATAGDVITVQYVSDMLLDKLTPTHITANGTGIYISILTKPRQVFKNGLYMLDTLDYTYTPTTLTFTNPTSITDIIVFIY